MNHRSNSTSTLRRNPSRSRMEADKAVVCEDPHMRKKAYTNASIICQKIARSSRYFNPKAEQSTTRLDKREIMVGKRLGQGGFNDVFEIRDIRLMPHKEASKIYPYSHVISSKHQEHYRDILSRHAVRRRDNTCRFAIKFLSKASMQNESQFCSGAMDLVAEAMILSSLNHPNIIKLHGLPAADTNGFLDGTYGGYFLVIDRLHGTLDKQIKKWISEKAEPPVVGDETSQRLGAHQKELSSRRVGSMNRSSSLRSFGNVLNEDERSCMGKRIEVAVEINSALAYLHAKGLIFRDLKPENVGFDARGSVKIFDFGLARELDPKERVGQEDYAMTGRTGSLRYMAPEVALSGPYGLKADVYSFSILLWEMCSLEVPFGTMDVDDHHKFAMLRDVRPSVPSCWPTSIRAILKKTWARDAASRPSMKTVGKMLKAEVDSKHQTLRKGQCSTRSTRSLPLTAF